MKNDLYALLMGTMTIIKLVLYDLYDRLSKNL